MRVGEEHDYTVTYMGRQGNKHVQLSGDFDPLVVTTPDATADFPNGALHGHSTTMTGSFNAVGTGRYIQVTTVDGYPIGVQKGIKVVDEGESLIPPDCSPIKFVVTDEGSPFQAGEETTVTVEAWNKTGVCNYNGDVSVSVNDPGATYPTTVHITNGSATFPVTFCRFGNDLRVRITDGTLKGATPFLTVLSGPATHLVVSGYPTPFETCRLGTLRVSARDACGNLATDYTGTVTFTASDPNATIPPQTTFTANNRGQRSFTMSWTAVGNQTITATDVSDPSITGDQSGIAISHGAFHHFRVTFQGNPTVIHCGEQQNLCVAALDLCGNTVTDYAGTVIFTSTDPDAELPTDYTFEETDAGVRCFPVSYFTSSTMTTTVTDSVECDKYGKTTTVTVVCP